MMNKYIIIGACFLLTGWRAQAQEKLSVSDAIKLGLENNYDIRIEKETVEKASNNNSWGQAGRMPKVDLNTTYNNNVSNINNDPQFNFGFVSPGFTLDNSRNNVITPTVNLGWTLFSGNKITITKRQLENLQRESSGNADIVVANNIQVIILGYYQVLLEKERLNRFQQQLDLSRDKYQYWLLKSDLGGAVRSQVLLEEGNYLSDSTNYINQELAYRKSLRKLNFVMAESEVDKDYELTSTLDMNWESLELEELQAGIEKNVDIKKLYISQEVLNNTLGIRKADRWPILSMNTGYRYNLNRQDLTNATSNLTDSNGDPVETPENASIARTQTGYINFTLTFNLYNGGKINRAIQNANTDLRIGNVRIEKLRASVMRDLSDAYDSYSIRRQVYEINSRKRSAAQQNLDISTEKYRNGSINSFDFRVVQNNYLVASIQELQSIFDLVDSRVTLMRLTGGLLENYVN
jgi:outer membrane protein TolC